MANKTFARFAPYHTINMPQQPAMDMNSFDEKRNLIVNYLPSNLSQDDVQKKFSEVGPVSNCKLIRNYETGQSLGYAFIEYPTDKLALDAIKLIDGTNVEGKILKVSYARQSSPDIKNSNVYIAGLPDHFSENELFNNFSPYGKIITHKLLINQDGSSKGVGFVRYSLKSEAQNAIEGMGGKILNNSKGPLTVKLAIPPVSKQQNSLLASTSQINALAGLPGVSTLRGSLRFNPLAPSNQAITNTPQILTGISTALDHQQALSQVNNPTLVQYKGESSLIQNQTSANANGAAQAFSVYIYGLQVHHNELHLYELFAPFGAILNVKLIRDLKKEDKPSKGYGFINFRKYEEAISAVTALNNQVLEGKLLQVSFKQNKPGISGPQPAGLLPTSALTSTLHQQHYQNAQQHQHMTIAHTQDNSTVFSNFHHMKYPN